MKTKSIIILGCILVAAITISAIYYDGLVSVQNESSTKKLPEQSQEDYDNMKIKAIRLMDAHNTIVMDFENDLPDPIDYTFDLDIGWTDTSMKQKWCNEIVQYLENHIVLTNELNSALVDLEDVDYKTPKLIENIAVDYELLAANNQQAVLQQTMFTEFNCNTEQIK